VVAATGAAGGRRRGPGGPRAAGEHSGGLASSCDGRLPSSVRAGLSQPGARIPSGCDLRCYAGSRRVAPAVAIVRQSDTT